MTSRRPESSVKKLLRKTSRKIVVEHDGARLERREVFPLVQTEKVLLSLTLFGTLKNICGVHQFLVRGLEKRRGEFSLMKIVCNFTWVLNIPGVKEFREFCLTSIFSQSGITRILLGNHWYTDTCRFSCRTAPIELNRPTHGTCGCLGCQVPIID